MAVSSIYATRTDVASTSIPASVGGIGTLGYTAVGDGGDWPHMLRVASEPPHVLKVRSSDRWLPDGTLDQANGGWWEYRPAAGPIPLKKFGAVGGAVFQAKTGPDDSTAFAGAQSYCALMGADLLVDDYYNLLDEYYSTSGFVVDGFRLLGIGKRRCGIRVRIGKADAVGTYDQAASTTVTASIAAHGHATGDLVYFDATSGGGGDGWVVITVVDANHFTFNATTSATASGTCRLLEFPAHVRAVSLRGQGAFVQGLEIMAHQWSDRPADRGDWGACVGMGYFGYGAPQPLTTQVGVDDVLLSRAPSTLDDASKSGAGVVVVGNVEGYRCTRLSYDNTSGIGFSYGATQHWGCSGRDPLGNPGETYHPHDGSWSFDGPLSGAEIGVGLSSSYNVCVGDFDATGCKQAVYILPGDNADAYAISRDSGRVMRGIRFGFITGILSGAGSGQHGIEIQGQSQSKWETIDGSPKLRNLDLDIVLEGSDLTYNGTCPASTDAIYVANHCGFVELGVCKSRGYSRRALYVYHAAGASNTRWNMTGSDQGIYYSGGGTADGIGNSVAPAYDDQDTGGLTILGQSLTGALAVASASGATSSTLSTSFQSTVFPGDIVKIGNNMVVATATTGPDGVTLFHSPLLSAEASGVAVTVSQHPQARLQPNTKGGRFGVRLVDCRAELWGAGPINSGQFGIRIEAGAVVVMNGVWPRETGQNSATTTNYDLYVAAGAHVSISAAQIGPAAASLEHHIFADTGASVHLVDAVFDGLRDSDGKPIKLYSGSLTDLTIGRLVDTTGVLVDLFGGSNSNGFYIYHQDGTLECWIRNIQTNSNGTYTWTFPAPSPGYLTQAGIDVQATPTSSSTLTHVHAISASGDTASINTWNASGTKAAANVNLKAVGRWR